MARYSNTIVIGGFKLKKTNLWPKNTFYCKKITILEYQTTIELKNNKTRVKTFYPKFSF